ncbi:MAG: putative lipid II flippase FtsW [Planctomycetota bacterium]|nr:putative lipid II flippase FtsW [Planctomycetota bacterium]
MLRAGHGLILCVVSLLVIGVVMVQSAGLRIVPDRTIDIREVLLGKQAALAAMAILTLFIASRLPVNKLYQTRGWLNPIPWIVLGSMALLLVVHLPGIGKEVNGARRWIELGPIGFQPSELAKWGFIIVIAWWAARHADSMHLLRRGFLPPMILLGLACVLIATEDLGTSVLIGTVGVCMLIAAGARLWHVSLLIPVGAAGFVTAVMTSEYRINRLKAFLDPFQDPQGIGYHIIQSMSAINGGGLAGRGLGNSVQKFGYLPEDTTDFIFAIICEELGVMGAAIVVCLYAALLLGGFSIIRRLTCPFQSLLGLGVLLTIGFQALINMAVVTGMAPTKGIALPLLSAGGTGWIVTAFSIGLLVSMDRTLAREAENAKPAFANRIDAPPNATMDQLQDQSDPHPSVSLGKA